MRIQVHRAGEHEAPVAERLDLETAAERPDPGESRLCTQLGIEHRADTRRMSLRRKFGIVEYRHHRVACAATHQRFQQAGSIRGATGAGVILRVGQHHGLVRCIAQRARDRLVGAQQFEFEFGLGGHHALKKLAGRGFDSFLIGTVGDYGRAALGDVGGRKTGREIDAGDAARAAHGLQRAVQRAAGFEVGALRG